jgi:hypothetical protein
MSTVDITTGPRGGRRDDQNRKSPVPLMVRRAMEDGTVELAWRTPQFVKVHTPKGERFKTEQDRLLRRDCRCGSDETPSADRACYI